MYAAALRTKKENKSMAAAEAVAQQKKSGKSNNGFKKGTRKNKQTSFQVQRAVPSLEQWKKDTNLTLRGRGKELQAVDEALKNWNEVKRESNPKRFSALQTLKYKIAQWLEKKKDKEKSRRKSKLSELKDEVNKEIKNLNKLMHGTGGIRRGNRKRSVIDTKGHSTAKVLKYRDESQKLIEFVRGKMLERGKAEGEVNEMLKEQTFISAIAVEEISVGNCEEFSEVVYAHWVQQQTSGQYEWVGRAKMVGVVEKDRAAEPKSEDDKYQISAQGNQKKTDWVTYLQDSKEWNKNKKKYDHIFNIISNTELEVGEVTGLDKTKVKVVDEWHMGKVMTLKEFMDKGNVYQEQLADENIRIVEATKATGENKLDPDLISDIKEWAVQFNEDFTKSEEAQKADVLFKEAQAGTLKGIFDT
jgi:hypothetical protein